MAGESNKPLIILPGLAPNEAETENAPEHRSTSRYPFTAAAEVFELRSQARITGRSSDVGIGGCYVDTISLFPVGTVVRVRLERESRKFEAMARITYAHETMGMGMVFTEIEPAYLHRLQTWIDELRGEPSPATEMAAGHPEDDVPENPNVRPVLNELINILVRKKFISEVEGARLLRQIFR